MADTIIEPYLIDQATRASSSGTSLKADPRAQLNRFLPSSAKLLLINSQDRSDAIEAQFNPTELQRSLGVNIGKLEPIGWSSPVQEYASTGALQFTLSLWLSEIAFQEQHSATQKPLGGPPEYSAIKSLRAGAVQGTGIQSRVRWLESFCYSEAPGLAPPPLFVCWPRNLFVLAVLVSVQTSVKLFDEMQNARIVEVRAEFSELRFAFRKRSSFLRAGFLQLDDDAYSAAGGQLNWNSGRTGRKWTVASGRQWSVSGNTVQGPGAGATGRIWKVEGGR